MQRRRVLVTGASKGIGRAMLDRLHQDGYEVVGIARSRPEGLGLNQSFLQCDLSDLVATRNLVTELARERPFYALVNNAAVAPTTSIFDTTLEDMQSAFRVNLMAMLVCTQAVLPGMKELGVGRIVNLSSRAALGKVNRSAYSATKAGVVGMSRTWALELARLAITVNVIAPGPIDTEMFRTATPAADPRTQALIDSIPVGRVGAPSDIAHAAAYLLDERAGFMTGQVMYIDGGLTVGPVLL